MKRQKACTSWMSGLVAIAVVTSLPAMARAQLLLNPLSNSNGTSTASNNGASSSGTPFALPLPIMPGVNQKLTPQQLQSIMLLRALQSRGSGRVRTGYPQYIPFGYGSPMQMLPGQQGLGADPAAAQPSDRDAQKEAARQKRIEALKAVAEKKKAAREARAEARKAQQAKDPAGGK